MPVQRGIMSAYQLMGHTHTGVGQGGQLNYINSLYNKPIIDAREYGLSIANTPVQNSTALALILAEQKNFQIVEGTYEFQDPFIVPDGVSIIGDGGTKTLLRYRGAGAYAIMVHEFSTLKGFAVYQTVDRAAVRAGILITSERNKLFDIIPQGFRYGYEFFGDGELCAFNDIYSMKFYGCYYDIYTDVANGGATTENRFFGGTLVASADVGSYGIYLNHVGGENPITTHRFFGVSIESLNDGVFCDGMRNEFFGCRFEQVGVNDIVWGANSRYNLAIGAMGGLVVVDNSAGKQNQMITSGSIATKFQYGEPDPLIIAAGVIDITQNYHTVDGEGGAADTLSTINGGTQIYGMPLVIQSVSAARVITVDEAGNIMLTGANCVLTDPSCKLFIIRDVTNNKWVELGRCTG